MVLSDDKIITSWKSSSSRKEFMSAIAVIYAVMAIGTSVMFCIRARKDQELSRRSTSLTVMGGITNAIASLVILLQSAFNNEFPCFLSFWSAHLAMMMLLLSLIGRSMRLLLYWRLNLFKSREKGLLKTKADGRCADDIVPYNQDIIDRNIWKGIIVFMGIDLVYIVVVQFTERTVPGETSIGIFPTISYSCPSYYPYWPFYVFIALFMLVISPLTVFLTWGTRDNFGIRNDIIISVSVGMPMYILYFIWLYVPQDLRYCMPRLLWVWFAFLNIHMTSVILPLTRSYYRQYWTEPKSDWSDFEQMILNPSLFSAFVKHSIEDFCVENTRFIEEYHTLRMMTVEGYRLLDSQLKPTSLDERAAKLTSISKIASQPLISPTISIATSIMAKTEDRLLVPAFLQPFYTTFYSMFVSSGSVLEVNLKSSTRREIIRQISSGSFKVTVFDDAMKEVLNLLFFDTFPKFYIKRKQLLVRTPRAWYKVFQRQQVEDLPLTRFA